MSSPNKIRRNHTFLTGVYLAVNAIRDLFLVIDGPNCIYKKVEIFEKNHDFYAKLFSSAGFHRISSTMTNVNNIHLDRTREIKGSIKKVAGYPRSSLVLLTSMPVASMTGVDYEGIVSSVSASKPCLYLPYGSLGLDWLDGYSQVLELMAGNLDISDRRRKGSVGIVGYMFDRNEGDNIGNIEEIKRLLEGLGLEVSSVWLSGYGIADMEKISEAEYIISMPYAGRAASLIAERTGAKVIEGGIPFGLKGTENWIRKVADAIGLDAKSVIEEEKKETVPILEWLVPAYLQGRKIAVAGDPYLSSAIAQALAEVDCNIVESVMYSRGRQVGMDNPVFDCDQIVRDDVPDFCIGNSDSRQYYSGVGFLEFGFPCYGRHCLFRQPYMGFRGFICFLNMMVNANGS